MSTIDVQQLLQPISPENLVGDDLSYDPAYLELDALAAGKPEQQVGEQIIPAEEPDWKVLKKSCVELLGRTKDLRVATLLTLAELKLNGIPGLAAGLSLLRGLCETYWDKVYPQLDPDDNNDPTLRINIISALTTPAGTYGDPMQFQQRMREAPLASSKQLGRFGVREIEIGRGEVAAPADSNLKVDPKVIDGAFESTSLEDLQAVNAALEQSVADIKGLDGFLTSTVGNSSAINFKDLEKLLGQALKYTQTYLAKRGVGAAPAEASADGDGAASGGGDGAAASAGSGAAISGDIRSKDDVIRMIDKICSFYARYEPSSPVPLLLKRAQRLVSKNFLEIIRDLNPAALDAIHALAGIDPNAAHAETPPAEEAASQ